MSQMLNTDEEVRVFLNNKFSERFDRSSRPVCKWQLPADQNLTLVQSHEFLREHLARPRSPREDHLRARLTSLFCTWSYKDDARIFENIAHHLDELLFGEILDDHAEYARIPMGDNSLGWSQLHRDINGFSHLVLIALNSDGRASADLQGDKPRQYTAILWGTLIHEMLHAYTMIAVGRGGSAIYEQCKCGEMVDHGPLWAETMSMLAARLDIGITVEDMTNCLEICHEPDHGQALAIDQYRGMFRTDGRRYSQGQNPLLLRNFEQADAPKNRSVAQPTAPDCAVVPRRRQRCDTFPGRSVKLPDGQTRLVYHG